MLRVAGDGGLDFTVDDNVDFHTGLSPAFEDLVEAPFLVEVRRAAEEQFG
jgi:hypothetical protein